MLIKLIKYLNSEQFLILGDKKAKGVDGKII